MLLLKRRSVTHITALWLAGTPGLPHYRTVVGWRSRVATVPHGGWLALLGCYITVFWLAGTPGFLHYQCCDWLLALLACHITALWSAGAPAFLQYHAVIGWPICVAALPRCEWLLLLRYQSRFLMWTICAAAPCSGNWIYWAFFSLFFFNSEQSTYFTLFNVQYLFLLQMWFLSNFLHQKRNVSNLLIYF